MQRLFFSNPKNYLIFMKGQFIYQGGNNLKYQGNNFLHNFNDMPVINEALKGHTLQLVSN